MASYDQLSAQQRAIVDLVLKRGRSYDDLADTLDLPVDRVRELARESLTTLAPISAAAVDADWRAPIADYLLGQQAPPDAATTRGHLRRSEAARAWSRSVLDSLEHLYPNGSMPTVPGGGHDVAPSPRGPAAPVESSPEEGAAIRRRRAAGAGALAVVLVVALLVWPVGLLTGGEADSPERADQGGGNGGEILGQAVLRPVGDADRDEHAGIAIVTRDGDELELNLQARLRPANRNQAYEVWLYDSDSEAVSLGAQVTDEQGNFAGRATLPENWRDYRLLDVSRERVDEDGSHSGRSVLRVRTDRIVAPQGR